VPAPKGTIIKNAPRGHTGPNKTTKHLKTIMCGFVAGNRDNAQVAMNALWKDNPAQGLALWIKCAELVLPKPAPHIEVNNAPPAPPPLLGICFDDGGPGFPVVEDAVTIDQSVVQHQEYP
jgi:hypothetical protein